MIFKEFQRLFISVIMNIPKKRYLIPAFVLFVLLIRFVSEIDLDKPLTDKYLVVDVIDGDTIELLGGDKLRLLGIDCPERGDPLYDSAATYLASMVLNKMVDISYSKKRRDQYGRILGYLFVDSVCINEAVLSSGLAYIYLFRDNLADSIRIKGLLSAQKEAMSKNSGIWARPISQEEFYLTLKGKLRFHRPNCGSVKNKPVSDLIKFDSRYDAFNDGYSPCRNCRP